MNKIESTNIHRRILFYILLNLVSSSFCIYTTPCVRSFFLFKFDYIGCDQKNQTVAGDGEKTTAEKQSNDSGTDTIYYVVKCVIQ